MFLTVIKFTLLLTSAFGFFALWGFSKSNGLFQYIPDMAETLFSNSEESSTLTGLTALDEQLRLLVSFFWPVLDGTRPDLSLHAMNFLFQGAAMWLVVVVEGLRRGNDWKVVSLYAPIHTFTAPCRY
jgi:hypothetical protein